MIGYILYAIMVAGLLISPAGLILACACHVRKKHVQAYLLLRISLILAGSAISIYVLRGVSVIYMMADNFTGLSASEIRTRNQLMAAACVPFLTGLTALAGPRFRLSRVVGRMLLTLPLFAIAQAWLAFLVDPDRSWEIHALIHGLLVYFTASCLLWVAVECSYRASLLEKTETAKKPDLNSAE